MTESCQREAYSSETTIGALLHQAAAQLVAAGIEAPQREARLLLEGSSGLTSAAILGWPERTLNANGVKAFNKFLDRRLNHEPLSRILGHRAFWTLDLEISPATLDPRPDTETIVEAALSHIGKAERSLRILDLGTGTGAILLALLSEFPSAWGVGVDCSMAALRIAAKNAALNGLNDRVSFLASDWASALNGTFDLIVSNPPYIESDEIPFLPPEVRNHDPLLALDGGLDGLEAYRKLIPALPRLLNRGGLAIVEIGMGQASTVANLLGQAGLRVAEKRADLAGIIRAVTAIQP